MESRHHVTFPGIATLLKHCLELEGMDCMECQTKKEGRGRCSVLLTGQAEQPMFLMNHSASLVLEFLETEQETFHWTHGLATCLYMCTSKSLDYCQNQLHEHLDNYFHRHYFERYTLNSSKSAASNSFCNQCLYRLEFLNLGNESLERSPETSQNTSSNISTVISFCLIFS